MTQTDLFSPSVVAPPSQPSHLLPGRPGRLPRARTTDPISSQQAADAADRFAGHQANQVLAALKKWPRSTTHELAKVSGLDRYAIGRRCSELREANLIVRILPTAATVPCAVSGKRVCRWEAR